MLSKRILYCYAKAAIAFAALHSTTETELTKKAVKAKVAEVAEYKSSRWWGLYKLHPVYP
jgi:hypothetical protein